MKKFLILSLIVSGVAAGVSIAQPAKAVVSDNNWTVNGCSTKDANGNIVAIGNTCGTGNAGCKSNACP